jgi:hypothetical protein
MKLPGIINGLLLVNWGKLMEHSKRMNCRNMTKQKDLITSVKRLLPINVIHQEKSHFYRELVAKRKQNGLLGGQNNILRDMHNTLKVENLAIVKRFLWYDFIEYVFIQKIFGYGVHP